jgi:hypothetical protein
LTADVVREVFRRCVEDGWLTQQIAKELNARLIPTAYGRDAREILAGDLLGTRAPREGQTTSCDTRYLAPGRCAADPAQLNVQRRARLWASHELAAGTGFARNAGDRLAGFVRARAAASPCE